MAVIAQQNLLPDSQFRFKKKTCDSKANISRVVWGHRERETRFLQYKFVASFNKVTYDISNPFTKSKTNSWLLQVNRLIDHSAYDSAQIGTSEAGVPQSSMLALHCSSSTQLLWKLFISLFTYDTSVMICHSQYESSIRNLQQTQELKNQTSTPRQTSLDGQYGG